MPTSFYSASSIYTGEEWRKDVAVVVKEGVVTDIITSGNVPADASVTHFDDGIITPALIDLQIYGAYGKLVSVYPEPDALNRLYQYCTEGGAAFFLPTVATNTYDVFFKSIDAIRSYWNAGGKGVLGIHLEGPWINPVKRGAHIASLIHSPTIDQAKRLLEYGKGVIKMITLAPECCSKEVIELILSYGIVISCGHSNASFDEANEGYKLGISTTTHLYNAMSPLQHRAPGVVGAAMTHATSYSSIIPDGHHVDYAAIRIAKEVMKDRLFVITDAVTETSSGPYQHYLVGDKYEADGILSGSALTMNKAIHNLVHHAGVSFEESIRMCSLYPAKVIGLGNELGMIAPGFRASFTVFDSNNRVAAVID